MDEDAELAAAIALSQAPDADEDAELAAAIAMSNAAPDDADAPADAEDAELAAAIALSKAPAPAPAPAEPTDPQARLQARVRDIFGELTAGGMNPNEAAAKALEKASAEARQRAAPAAAPAAAASAALLEKAGFEARVKDLFAQAVGKGSDANEAAAAALKQAQAEQLAAANQARRDRAAAESGAAAAEGGADEPMTLEAQMMGSTEVEKFERWEEIEKVNQAQVDAINLLYREEGVTFVDPSWPPTDRALYMTTETATTWKCRACSKRNPLPPPPPAETLMRMMLDPRRHAHTCAYVHIMHMHTRTSSLARLRDARPSQPRAAHTVRPLQGRVQ